MKLLKLAGITITITIVATLLIKADQILSRDGVEQTKRDPVVFEADKDQKTEIDNNESLPSKLLVFIGTPITGICVFAAVIPGR